MRSLGAVRRTVVLGLFVCLGAVASGIAVFAARWCMRPLPRLEQIRYWADTSQWSAATAAVNEYLKRRPHDVEALLLAARVAAAQGELEQCAQLLEKVPPGAAQKLAAMFRQGQALREASWARRAEHVWREALALSERHPARAAWRQAIQAELVSLLSLERRAAEARLILWDMYPDHAEKWRILVALARLEARGTNPESALPLLQQCIDRDPTDLDARRGRVRYLLDASGWDEAEQEVKRILAQDPQDTAGLEMLLQCRVVREQWDAVDPWLARNELDATNPTVWRLRALRYKARDDWDNAELCFQQALQLKSTDSITHYQFAQLLLLRNQRARAEQHQERARELAEHTKGIDSFLASIVAADTENWTRPTAQQCVELADHCRAFGRTDEARGWLGEAIRQRPGFPEALQALQRITEAPADRPVAHADRSNGILPPDPVEP